MTRPILMQVRDKNKKLVPGYRTLTVLAVTPKRRGILYQKVLRSEEPGFVSEPAEVQTMLSTVHEALVAGQVETAVTWLLDSGFDDVAVWRTIWERHEHAVCRVCQRTRLVKWQTESGTRSRGPLEEAAKRLKRLAMVRTKLEVPLGQQVHSKRQEVDVEMLGAQAQLPVRLLLVRVSEEVAEQRRQHIRERAAAHGTPPCEERLYLAGWTIVVTNVPHKLASLPEALVLLRLRWQIERLFRLWKEHGQIDEWRSKKPWRILCELYAKLAAMVIQQWLIHEGCWSDPWRSLVQAAAVVRREANRIMIALREGGLEQVLHSIVRGMASGCRLQRRRGHPSTVQLLLEGLDWHLCLT